MTTLSSQFVLYFILQRPCLFFVVVVDYYFYYKNLTCLNKYPFFIVVSGFRVFCCKLQPLCQCCVVCRIC